MLCDPAYVVPPPPPAGPVGTLTWLRATVSRFSAGADHARRRALILERLAAIEPAWLSERARETGDHVVALAEALGASDAAAAAAAVAEIAPHYNPAPGGDRPGKPAEPPAAGVLADPQGTAADAQGTSADPQGMAADAHGMAADAHGTAADATAAGPPAAGAPDAAVAALLTLLPPAEPERVAQDIAILVQACAATAALIANGGALDPPPVPATRRIAPDGSVVTVDLAPHPFGAGPRACPGAEHALALAQGVLESR